MIADTRRRPPPGVIDDCARLPCRQPGQRRLGWACSQQPGTLLCDVRTHHVSERCADSSRCSAKGRVHDAPCRRSAVPWPPSAGPEATAVASVRTGSPSASPAPPHLCLPCDRRAIQAGVNSLEPKLRWAAVQPAAFLNCLRLWRNTANRAAARTSWRRCGRRPTATGNAAGGALP